MLMTKYGVKVEMVDTLAKITVTRNSDNRSVIFTIAGSSLAGVQLFMNSITDGQADAYFKR